MAEGFLGRWSKRKDAVRKGEEVQAEPEVVAPAPAPVPAAAAPAEVPAPPTLEDAQALTAESDFTRFTAPNVSPEVRNAAMKKLFADPHFNVMDGLDTYIDDYGKPDPLPPEMLKQLASAKFLKLFDEEEEKPQTRESAEGPGAQGVAQSDPRSDLPSSTNDADPDLRLQQDDAPGPRGPGPGAG
ncbi:DUF3306 domain-containing protein [Ramlibacter sp. XY19]|uniref:DUF3306 domain-containing protein n=1 Tax=Ramlibacter paludis TaxID=2908000 RepID=UPI0023DC4F56|nr:DUF3306 domain-containing protein [Ramlibacter paludis]MCG2592117.1 DUF3306 domain-containing protein [Ramlibacter paludis]